MVTSSDTSDMQQIGSYYWPADDRITPMVVLRESARLPIYLKHCQKRDVCIQAGGNCGVYAQILAHWFKQVLTFEPDPQNWRCLNVNVTAPNVTVRFAALGDCAGKVETWRKPNESANYGATMVRSSDAGADVVRIDDLNMAGLSLLLLDVEGFELPALRGAENTILQFKPTIAVEVKGLGQHYGYTDADLLNWLASRGYQEAERIGRDIIFFPTT